MRLVPSKIGHPILFRLAVIRDGPWPRPAAGTIGWTLPWPFPSWHVFCGQCFEPVKTNASLPPADDNDDRKEEEEVAEVCGAALADGSVCGQRVGFVNIIVHQPASGPPAGLVRTFWWGNRVA